MGVSSSGKSTIGSALAKKLGWQFFDGDDIHSESNVQKMAQGVPLTDEDRKSWLSDLHDLIAEQIELDIPAVVACSALKQSYRDRLLEGNKCTEIVYLRGDFELIYQRMQKRHEHYMKTEMLQSQFETLEEPHRALVVDVDQSVDRIIDQIISGLGLE
jgi:gluconokinase